MVLGQRWWLTGGHGWIGIYDHPNLRVVAILDYLQGFGVDWVARLPSRDAWSPDRKNDILQAGDPRDRGGRMYQAVPILRHDCVIVTDGSLLTYLYVAAADRESTSDDMGIR